MTIEEFRNLAQGLQAVFIAIAAIVASGWALYTFRSLMSVQKTKADLNKINGEIDKSKTELAILQKEHDQKPMLTGDIEPSFFKVETDNSFFILIKLNLKNTGNTNELVDWRKSNIKAAFVNKISTEGILYSDPIDGILGRIKNESEGLLLWPGEEVSEEFVIPIEKHGLYIVETAIYVNNESSDKITSVVPEETIDNSVCFGPSVYFDTRA